MSCLERRPEVAPRRVPHRLDRASVQPEAEQALKDGPIRERRQACDPGRGMRPRDVIAGEASKGAADFIQCIAGHTRNAKHYKKVWQPPADAQRPGTGKKRSEQ